MKERERERERESKLNQSEKDEINGHDSTLCLADVMWKAWRLGELWEDMTMLL